MTSEEEDKEYQRWKERYGKEQSFITRLERDNAKDGLLLILKQVFISFLFVSGIMAVAKILSKL